MWHHVELYPTSCDIMWHRVELYPTSCDIMWYHVASCGIDRDATAGGSIPHKVASCDMVTWWRGVTAHII
eukprot:gene21480-biopygen10179